MKLLEQWFPLLRGSGGRITSEPTPSYNCIAWAAGDDRNWWEPHPDAYWPPSAPREYTLDAYVAAYEAVGYMPCATGELDAAYEKVAVYATADGRPQHAARQLPDGRWTSKLGRLEDIEHGPDGVDGPDYGRPVRFLRRRR